MLHCLRVLTDERLLDYKFDLLYSKRAFVHWYVGEGMEEVSRHSHALFRRFDLVTTTG